MSATEIIQAAMGLSSKQRADLAMQLLVSLDDEGDAEIAEEAWAQEVADRLASVDEGSLPAHDWQDSVQYLMGQVARRL